MLNEITYDHIAYRCDEAAYKVLSDPNISKITSGMSEEGREAVAKAIADKLRKLLEQEAAEKKIGPKRIFIDARPYYVE